MSALLFLNCYVLGDDLEHIFPVKISSSERVGELKEVIQAKKSHMFKHVDPDTLKVWKVSLIPEDSSFEGAVGPCNFSDKGALKATKVLSGVFSDSPLPERVHIVVKPPPVVPHPGSYISASPIISLNCYVLGDEPRLIFSVKVASSDTVSDLKKAIKAEKSHRFEHVDADTLQVWKVLFPEDPSFEGAVDAFSFVENALPATEVLSEVFLGSPPPKYVHVLVKPPSDDILSALPPSRPSLLTMRESFFNRPRKAPSAHAKPAAFERLQEEPPFYYACSRPPDREPRLPLTLVDPVFGRFVDNCTKATPTAKEYQCVASLKREMCKFYGSEKKRRSALCEVFQEYGINVNPGPIRGTSFETDGHVLSGQRPTFILELKNEIGALGTEPSLQALLYYDVFCDMSSTSPCFVIAVAGPYLIFGGCALTDRCTLEIFSSIPLGFHASNWPAYDALARHLSALTTALTDLSTRYAVPVPQSSRASTTVRPSRSSNRDVLPRPTPAHPAYVYDVAYPRTFTDLRGPGVDAPVAFTYGEVLPKELEESTNLIFNGQTEHGQILVKFVRQYGKDVHTWCADRGFGPKLLGFEELAGGWLMVVMELLDTLWVRLADVDRTREGLKERICAAVTDLHQHGMVHGDLRDTNVMVERDGEGFMLIDYDWAGLSGQVKYPMLVNKDAVLRRPADVEDCKPILTTHDDVMFENMFDL